MAEERGIAAEIDAIWGNLRRLQTTVEVSGNELSHIKEDIAEIKSYLRWVVFLLLGGILSAILNLVVV